MKNALLAFPNLIDVTFYDVRIFGGDWPAPFDLDNLKDRRFSEATRSASLDLEDTQFEWDLGIDRNIFCVAVPRSDISRSGRTRLRTTNVPMFSNVRVDSAGSIGATTMIWKTSNGEEFTIPAGTRFSFGGGITHTLSDDITLVSGSPQFAVFTPALAAAVSVNTSVTCHSGKYEIIGGYSQLRDINLNNLRDSNLDLLRVIDNDISESVAKIDTGWVDVWPVVFPWEFDLPYGHPSWYDRKISAEDAVEEHMPYVHIDTTGPLSRFGKLEIDDDSNPNGYITLERLMVTYGWLLPINISYGARLGLINNTSESQVKGGASYYDVSEPQRRIGFNVHGLTTDDGMTQAFELSRKLGIHKQLFFCLDPDNLIHRHRWSFTATLQDLTDIDFAFYNGMDAPFNLKEVIA